MDKNRAFWTRLLWGLLVAASVAWMAVYVLYVEEAMGWQNAADTLLPDLFPVGQMNAIDDPLVAPEISKIVLGDDRRNIRRHCLVDLERNLGLVVVDAECDDRVVAASFAAIADD